MVCIIPAILPKSFEDLKDKLLHIRDAASEVQIDMVDGRFAPNMTWPYNTGGWRLEAGGWKEKLPMANEFEFEIDLMVEKAEDAAEAWRAAGAKRIVIHIESPDARAALLALRFEKEEAGTQGASLGAPKDAPWVGLALPSSGSVEMLEEYENLYDYAQVMGIEKVGFQGQPFDPRAIGLVRQLRGQNPSLAIQVDGGVGEKNIRALIAAGANRLVVGSAIWESEDPKKALRQLQNLV